MRVAEDCDTDHVAIVVQRASRPDQRSVRSGLADWNNRCGARRGSAELRPSLRELASLLKQIAAAIGGLYLRILRASAISATSAGKLVRSAAQSRNVERKPCAVRSSRPK